MADSIECSGSKISDDFRMFRKQRFQFRKKCRHFGIVRRASPLTQFLDALFYRVISTTT